MKANSLKIALGLLVLAPALWANPSVGEIIDYVDAHIPASKRYDRAGAHHHPGPRAGEQGDRQRATTAATATTHS